MLVVLDNFVVEELATRVKVNDDSALTKLDEFVLSLPNLIFQYLVAKTVKTSLLSKTSLPNLKNV